LRRERSFLILVVKGLFSIEEKEREDRGCNFRLADYC
jgi:hypothetical protein